MWVKTTNRRELIDILQARILEDSGGLFSRYEFSAVSSLSPPHRTGDLILVWQDDPREMLTLPNLIVADGDERDLLAWALTYLNTLTPLTAYIRVSNFENAEQAFKFQPTPNLHRLENACAGLILGETATYLEGQRDLNQVPARACTGTYSFVMARALALGAVTMESDTVSNGWFEARELTRQTSVPLTKDALHSPWYVLLGLESGAWKSDVRDQVPSSVLDAILDLYLKGEIDNRQWRSLESEVPGVGDLGKVMRGPREDRVLVLEDLVRHFRSRPEAASLSIAFVLGYLASQIAPGTLDHLQLVSPYVHIFPGILLWYGFCAGLHRRSNVASYAGGLGRRAIREVLRREALLDRPTCDLSLAELRVINAKQKAIFDFRTGSNTQLEVEIAPCITATLRWPPRTESPEQLFPPRLDVDALDSIQFDLDDTSERLQEISLRLSRLTARADATRGRTERKPRRR
jgi:hypothetical protein